MLAVFSWPYLITFFSYCFDLVWELIYFSSCIEANTSVRFWSFINECGIHLAKIFCTFKICFKMKCNSNMQTGFVTSQIVYLTSVSIISLTSVSIISLTLESFALPVTVAGQSYFAASLMVKILITQCRIFTLLRMLFSFESRSRGFFDSIRIA